MYRDKVIWVAAALAASAAHFFSSAYGAVHVAWCAPAVALAMAACVTATWREDRSSTGRLELLLLPAATAVTLVLLQGAALLCWVLPLALVSFVAAVGGRYWQRGRRQVGLWAVLTIIVLTLLILIQKLGSIANWFVYDMRLFDLMAHPLLLALGFDVTWARDGLLIADGRSIQAIHFGPDRGHLFWGISFVLVWAMLHRTLRGRIAWRHLRIAVAFVAVISFTWIVAVTALWVYTKQAGLLVNRWLMVGIELMVALAVLPLIRWPHWSRPQDGASDDGPIPLRIGRPSLTRVLAGTAIVSAVVFCLWYPIGTRKDNSAILVDDYHSSWEFSDAPFTFSQESMTKTSAYSYTTAVDYLRCFYPVTINPRQADPQGRRLDELDLSRYSVIVLKTPAIAYTSDERRALREFVACGGGLFLHGDHTNLFGMSEQFNELLAGMGIRFNCDDQADFAGHPSRLRPIPNWRTHPTFRRVREFQFLTSCTLRSRTPLVEPVIVSGNIFSEDARYGRPGFFGNMALDAKDRTGGFLQAAVVPYGRGRVAVFTDSTMFANFASFQCDLIRYAVDSIEYLQYVPHLGRSVVGGMALVLALAAGVTAALQAWRLGRRPTILPALCCDLPIALAIGSLLALMLTRSENLRAKPIQSPRTIAVVLDNASNTDVLSVGMMPSIARMVDFGNFVTSLQRAGYFPYVTRDFREAVKTFDRVILINPTKKWEADDILQLHRAMLYRHVRCLVLDSISNLQSTSRELLHPFALTVRTVVRPSYAYMPGVLPDLRTLPAGATWTVLKLVRFDASGDFVPLQTNTPIAQDRVKRTVEGGLAVRLDAEGDVCCVEMPFHGGGKLMAYMDSINFSCHALGGAFMQALKNSEIERTRSVQYLMQEFER